MKTQVVNGVSMPNIPWMEKPEGCRDVVWRYSANPIIKRDQIMVKKANGYREPSNSIFNSSVVPFEMELHVGFSKDGINWDINEERIHFECDIPEVAQWQYGYDPRVCKLEDKYVVTWCNAYGWKPTIGIAYTYDFKTFTQLENAYLPFNRNGVLFPRKINGYYMMMSRPSDNGHTPFGDIFVSQSKDMEFWGRHRHMMSPVRGDESAWQCTKIGAGPVPIETDEGWLLIYHGVITTCNGYVYRMGCALLDIDEPWKVKYRTKDYIMAPLTQYECMGDVPNVVFPCATLSDAATGRITIYYGCADTVTGMAFTTVDELLNYVKENSL